jgi:hypothetical protein
VSKSTRANDKPASLTSTQVALQAASISYQVGIFVGCGLKPPLPLTILVVASHKQVIPRRYTRYDQQPSSAFHRPVGFFLNIFMIHVASPF